MMRFEFKGQTYCQNLSAAERATIRQFLQGVAGKRTTPGSSLTIEDGVLMYEQTAIAWINRAGELWGGIPSGARWIPGGAVAVLQEIYDQLGLPGRLRYEPRRSSFFDRACQVYHYFIGNRPVEVEQNFLIFGSEQSQGTSDDASGDAYDDAEQDIDLTVC